MSRRPLAIPPGKSGIIISTREEVVRGIWRKPKERKDLFITGEAGPQTYAVAVAEFGAATDAVASSTAATLSPEIVVAIHEYLRREGKGDAQKLARYLRDSGFELPPRRIIEPLISKELRREAHRPKSPKQGGRLN
jgi:hypothetical protein